MKYGKDQEVVNFSDNLTKSDVSYQANGNVWINDGGGFPPEMGPDNWHPLWDPITQQVPPSVSNNETFVGFNDAYYFSYEGNPANLAVRQNNHAYTGSGYPPSGSGQGDLFLAAHNPPGLVFHVIQSGTTAATEPAAYATATDPFSVPLGGKTRPLGTIINDGTAVVQAEPENPYFPMNGVQLPASRADAGLPPLAGYVGYGDDKARFPLPAACGSRPAGNVAIP
jgi:hypothetical protein